MVFALLLCAVASVDGRQPSRSLPMNVPRPGAPRLVVTTIDLAPNVDGFGIVFGYKNVGTAPVPARGQLTEKPNWSVFFEPHGGGALTQLGGGDLWLPNAPAPPGYELATHFGGQIAWPVGIYSIPDKIVVVINSRKAAGMPQESKRADLHALAAKYAHDLSIQSVTVDWNASMVTAVIRKDGFTPGAPVSASVSINMRHPPVSTDPHTSFGEGQVTTGPISEENRTRTITLPAGNALFTLKERFLPGVKHLSVWVAVRPPSQDFDLSNNTKQIQVDAPPRPAEQPH
jgi:hypothetical protein